MTEKRISDCKGTSIEIIQSEEERERKIEKKWTKPPGFGGYYHRSHIYVIKVSYGKERKNGAEKIFEEVMAENCPNLVKA